MAGYTGAPPIVTDGLVFALDAANYESYISGSNTWYNIVGGLGNATLSNATSSLNSIEFTRANNTRATISPTLNLSTTNVITIDFWVNFKSLPTTSGIICELSDNFNSFSDSFYVSVEYELTGFRWMAADRGNSAVNSGYNVKNLITPLPVINTWYNTIIVYDHTQTASNQRSFYINGILQTNIASTANSGNVFNAPLTNNFGNRIFRIGGRGSNSASQDMYLSNFKIYNRALTSQEVSQNYNALKCRFNL